MKKKRSNQQLKEKQEINMDLSKYNPNSQFLLYKTDKGDIKVDVLLQNETIWMPQSKIAELFEVKIPAISKHLKNIFESGELNEKVVVSILEITTQHKWSTKIYENDAKQKVIIIPHPSVSDWTTEECNPWEIISKYIK